MCICCERFLKGNISENNSIILSLYNIHNVCIKIIFKYSLMIFDTLVLIFDDIIICVIIINIYYNFMHVLALFAGCQTTTMHYIY